MSDTPAKAAFPGTVVGSDQAAIPTNLQTDDLLRGALRDSALFSTVAYLHELRTQPHLLITAASETTDHHQMMRRGFQCFEPYLMIFTVGLVPSVCKIDTVLRLTLANADRSRSTVIPITYTSSSVIGWAAVFLRLSPSWSGGAFASQYGEVVRRGFIAKADEIESLLKRTASGLTSGSRRPRTVSLAAAPEPAR